MQFLPAPPSFRLLLITAAVAATFARSLLAQPTAETPTASLPLVSGQALRPPPVIKSKNGVLQYTMVAGTGNVTIAGRTVTGTLNFNGQYPGPTLAVNPGDTMNLTIVNGLNEDTNLHTHGFHVSPAGISDNVLRTMKPGSVSNVSITLPPNHPAGLFWYHPHMHGLVDEQIYFGMTGAILVGNPLSPFPSLRHVKQDVMDLQGIVLSADGSTILPESSHPADQTILVNGQYLPTVTMHPNEVRLWRLANISNDHFFRLRLPGLKFKIVALDGNTCDQLVTADEVLLAPAQRADVLVIAAKPGRYTLEQAYFDQGFLKFPPAPVLTLRVAGPPVAPIQLPAKLIPFLDLRKYTNVERQSIVFSESAKAPVFFINHQVFDPSVVTETAPLNKIQEWKLFNRTTEDHPFHIHTNPFIVTKMNDEPVPVHGYRDTVIIPKGQNLTIRFFPRDYLGKAVFHCHITFHEDHGMMAIVEWVGPNGQHDHTPCPDCEDDMGMGGMHDMVMP